MRELVVCAVTASQTVAVARSLGAGHSTGHLVPRLQFGLARREGEGGRA